MNFLTADRLINHLLNKKNNIYMQIEDYIDEITDVLNLYPEVTDQLDDLMNVVTEAIEDFMNAISVAKNAGLTSFRKKNIEANFAELETVLMNLRDEIGQLQKDPETAVDAEDADTVRETITDMLMNIEDSLRDDFDIEVD